MEKEELESFIDYLRDKINHIYKLNQKCVIELNSPNASKFFYISGVMSCLISKVNDDIIDYYNNLEDDEEESQQGEDSDEKAEKRPQERTSCGTQGCCC